MRRIRITGEITPVTAAAFLADLASAKGEPIQVLVNSEGGDVQAGFEMYEGLLAYPSRSVAIVESLAASMASVIVLGADQVEMTEGARYMIHPPETMPGVLYGERDTADNLEARAEHLRQIEDRLLLIYEESSTLDREALTALWGTEPYLTADQAIEYGFADRKILSVPDAAAVAKVTLRKNAPKELARMVALAKGKRQMDEEQMKALRASLGLSETASAEDVMKAIEALKAEASPAESEVVESEVAEDDAFAAEVAKMAPAAQARVLGMLSGATADTKDLLAQIPENLRAFASKLAPAALREFVAANGRSTPAKPAKSESAKTGKSDAELRVIAKAQAKAGLGSEDAIFALLKKAGK